MIDTAIPVLYILMRTDLDSMNSGKGMAQASHASNAFVHSMSNKNDKAVIVVNHLYEKWLKETTQGFGTVLVLGVNERQMRAAVIVAARVGFVSDVIHDPTYPIHDGEICHTLPLDTCGYVFGDKNDPILGTLLGNFNLHP